MTIWSVEFWKATAERAVKTAAQTGAATYGADVVNVLATDWAGVLGMAAGGAVLSVLTSLASSQVGDSSGPSVTGERLDGEGVAPIPPEIVEAIREGALRSGEVPPELTDRIKRAIEGYWGGN